MAPLIITCIIAQLSLFPWGRLKKTKREMSPIIGVLGHEIGSYRRIWHLRLGFGQTTGNRYCAITRSSESFKVLRKYYYNND
jgi:hypothetical protein